MYKHAVARHTDLSLVEPGTEGGGTRCRVEIGIVEDNEIVGAAELERYLLQMASGQFADAASHRR
ncbi:hypothetical protein D3C86_2219260 [compost metagenome]